jgi:hypothetical protein
MLSLITFIGLLTVLDVLSLRHGADSRRLDDRPNW